jgi:hypothetical protein
MRRRDREGTDAAAISVGQKTGHLPTVGSRVLSRDTHMGKDSVILAAQMCLLAVSGCVAGCRWASFDKRPVSAPLIAASQLARASSSAPSRIFLQGELVAPGLWRVYLCGSEKKVQGSGKTPRNQMHDSSRGGGKNSLMDRKDASASSIAFALLCSALLCSALLCFAPPHVSCHGRDFLSTSTLT